MARRLNNSSSKIESESDSEQESAYMPGDLKTRGTHPLQIPQIRRPSFLSRVFGRFQSIVECFRSISKSNLWGKQRAKIRPGIIPSKFRKKKSHYDSGAIPVRKGNNLGLERPSCEAIDTLDQNDGGEEEETNMRTQVDYFRTPLRPPTRFREPYPENWGNENSQRSPDIKEKEILSGLPPRPPSSARGRERHKSQFRLVNPPLDHSTTTTTTTSLGTLHEEGDNQDNLDIMSSSSSCSTESLPRISRPHMKMFRATSPSCPNSYSENPRIIPTIDSGVGSYRENFHRQMKLARSVSNGVTPIRAEQMINALRMEGLSDDDDDDESEKYTKIKCDEGDSIYNKTLEFEDSDFEDPKQESEFSASDALVYMWGDIGSFYLPLDGSFPMRSGPSFPIFDKTVDLKRIEAKHIRAQLNRLRAAELKDQEIEFNAERWDKRRIIGEFKKKLRRENNFPSMKIVGDFDTHFHHINWFSSGKDSTNYVGRYFDLEKNRLVAIKIFGYGFARSESQRLQSKVSAMNEISSLVKIECANVVQLLAYFELNSRVYLVLEACDHSLRSEISKAMKGIHQNMAQGVLRQIVIGLEFCHNIGCLHCDICPDNILVTSDGILKLADFKRAVFLSAGEEKPFCPGPGTIAYGAPELLLRCSEYGLPADIWSVGCLLAELLKGTPLWNCPTEAEQLAQIQQTFGALIHKKPNVITYSGSVRKGLRSLREMFPRISEDAVLFVSKCLELEPKKRGTCEGLLQHNFLKYDREGVEAKPVKPSMAEAILPRTERLWNLRPHSAPMALPVPKQSDNSIDAEENLYPTQRILSDTPSCLEVSLDYQEEVLATAPVETKRKKSQSKTKTHPRNNDTNTTEEKETQPSEWQLQPKHHYAARRIQEMLQQQPSSCDSASDSSCQVPAPSILKKGVKTERKTTRKKGAKVSFAEDCRGVPSSFICQAQTQCENPKKPLSLRVSTTPSVIMKNIITSVRSSSWSNVDVFTSQLKSLQKTYPKVFAAQVGTLLGVLLEQIAATKSKVAGPSIRILRTIYDFAPKLLEPEFERIIPAMLAKLGGPLFIDTECCDILQQIVIYTNPARAAIALVKASASQKLGVGRAASAKYLCDVMRRLNFVEDVGDDTAGQRRLAGHLFEAANRLTKDTHNNTRDYGKEILRILLPHPHFWRLYLANIPEDQRLRMNPILDEIRRVNPTLDEIRRKVRS